MTLAYHKPARLFRTISTAVLTPIIRLGANPGSVSTNLYIGNGATSTIDDVRIYNRALSAADIAQLYASRETIIRKPAQPLGLVGIVEFQRRHVDERA